MITNPYVRSPSFQDRERDFFDALVRETGDTWWGNQSRAGVSRLERRAQIIASVTPKNASVLELGCGAGALTLRLLRLAPELRLSACDISPVALKAARERCARFPNVSFIESDILNLPQLEKFDAVIGNGILHHLPLLDAIGVIRSLLKPGGTIAFFEPNLLNPHVAVEKTIRPIGSWLGNSEDEQAFSRFEVAKALKDSRFLSVHVAPIDFLHPRTPAFALPMAARVGTYLERTPLVREFAGSLYVYGRHAQC
jgi:SAM-dependent methyltransferase